jgi:hypothetical protein
MGNYNFSVQKHPQVNSIVKIKKNKYTVDQEIPSDILREGHEVQVLKTGNLLQSRKNYPPVAVSTVRFKNGIREAYLTTNLEYQ